MEWFPRYPIAYMTDTVTLSLAAHGAYCLLIDRYMLTEKPIPDDDDAIARILMCAPDEWRSVADDVRRFFEAKDGVLTHKRCEQELNKQKSRKKRRVAAAHAGAKARHDKKPQSQKKDIAEINKPDNDLPAYRTATANHDPPIGKPSDMRIAQHGFATGQDRTEETPLVPHKTVGVSSVNTESDRGGCARETNTEPGGGDGSGLSGAKPSPPSETGPSPSGDSEPDGAIDHRIQAAANAKPDHPTPWMGNLSSEQRNELLAIPDFLKAEAAE